MKSILQTMKRCPCLSFPKEVLQSALKLSGRDRCTATRMKLSHTNKDIGMSSNMQPNLMLASKISKGHGQCLFSFPETEQTHPSLSYILPMPIKANGIELFLLTRKPIMSKIKIRNVHANSTPIHTRW